MMTPISTLASSKQLERYITETANSLNDLTTQISTEKKIDLYRTSTDDIARIFSLARDFGNTQTDAFNLSVLKSKSMVASQSLEAYEKEVDAFAIDFRAALDRSDQSTLSVMLDSAHHLRSLLHETLNRQHLGEHVFAGQATDAKPIAAQGEVDALFEDLAATTNVLLPGATQADVDAFLTAVDESFNDVRALPAENFTGRVYLGSTAPEDVVKYRDGSGVESPALARADEGSFRQLIMADGLLAFVNEHADVLSAHNQRQILSRAAASMETGVASLRTRTNDQGIVVASLSRSDEQTSSDLLELEKLLGERLNADINQLSVQLTSADTHLKIVFQVTSRLNALGFENFI
ncbi:MAG: hypothetical protein ACFB3T_14280 [Geminicoccaceae bacterium]